jgi:hypothetical protein
MIYTFQGVLGSLAFASGCSSIGSLMVAADKYFCKFFSVSSGLELKGRFGSLERKVHRNIDSLCF